MSTHTPPVGSAQALDHPPPTFGRDRTSDQTLTSPPNNVSNDLPYKQPSRLPQELLDRLLDLLKPHRHQPQLARTVAENIALETGVSRQSVMRWFARIRGKAPWPSYTPKPVSTGTLPEAPTAARVGRFSPLPSEPVATTAGGSIATFMQSVQAASPPKRPHFTQLPIDGLKIGGWLRRAQFPDEELVPAATDAPFTVSWRLHCSVCYVTEIFQWTVYHAPYLHRMQIPFAFIAWIRLMTVQSTSSSEDLHPQQHPLVIQEPVSAIMDLVLSLLRPPYFHSLNQSSTTGEWRWSRCNDFTIGEYASSTLMHSLTGTRENMVAAMHDLMGGSPRLLDAFSRAPRVMGTALGPHGGRDENEGLEMVEEFPIALIDAHATDSVPDFLVGDQDPLPPLLADDEMASSTTFIQGAANMSSIIIDAKLFDAPQDGWVDAAAAGAVKSDDENSSSSDISPASSTRKSSVQS
ncbi:hypothetical protein BC828DRAFT_392087 [Blastocladiella britannica]|nr:hypothetical protein BC828DRAFT_392087 [Blastocladiella britannica]